MWPIQEVGSGAQLPYVCMCKNYMKMFFNSLGLIDVWTEYDIFRCLDITRTFAKKDSGWFGKRMTTTLTIFPLYFPATPIQSVHVIDSQKSLIGKIINICPKIFTKLIGKHCEHLHTSFSQNSFLRETFTCIENPYLPVYLSPLQDPWNWAWFDADMLGPGMQGAAHGDKKLWKKNSKSLTSLARENPWNDRDNTPIWPW